ncbi:hypothetical protein BJV77DRAFT_634846 [Russula vinacea]|nr:hypothetical protein BJV77DRAFT_634846 [Russula vinacea]
MVNYKDPATMAQDYEALVKMWHLIDGVFIWEFLSTLDFEWDVIRGHRPYRWTIWVYSLARVSTLLAVILNIVGLNYTSEMNCQAWATFLAIFAYLAYVSSTLLIVLRVIAIWNKVKIVFAIAMGIWITDNGVFIYGVSQLRSKWTPEDNACALLNVYTTKPAVIGSLFSDVVLLLIMLFGLLRLRCKGGGAFSMGRTLWKQGLIWLLVATVAEVPSTVFLILNLNDSLNLVRHSLLLWGKWMGVNLLIPLRLSITTQISQDAGMVIVTIAATRLYRSLTNIYSSDISHEYSRGTGRSPSEPRVQPGPIPLMDVSVRTECNQFATSQTRSGAYISTDSQGRPSYEAHKVNLGVICVESGLEK